MLVALQVCAQPQDGRSRSAGGLDGEQELSDSLRELGHKVKQSQGFLFQRLLPVEACFKAAFMMNYICKYGNAVILDRRGLGVGGCDTNFAYWDASFKIRVAAPSRLQHMAPCLGPWLCELHLATPLPRARIHR